jgi:hypothetical protein
MFLIQYLHDYGKECKKVYLFALFPYEMGNFNLEHVSKLLNIKHKLYYCIFPNYRSQITVEVKLP